MPDACGLQLCNQTHQKKKKMALSHTCMLVGHMTYRYSHITINVKCFSGNVMFASYDCIRLSIQYFCRVFFFFSHLSLFVFLSNPSTNYSFRKYCDHGMFSCSVVYVNKLKNRQRTSLDRNNLTEPTKNEYSTTFS